MREKNVPPPPTLDSFTRNLPDVAEILLASERRNQFDPDKLFILEGAIREIAARAAQTGRETDSLRLMEVAGRLATRIAEIRAST